MGGGERKAPDLISAKSAATGDWEEPKTILKIHIQQLVGPCSHFFLLCTGLVQKLITVSEEIDNLMERRSINLPKVKETLSGEHLSKDIHLKVRQIENKYKSSFSTEHKRTGCFNQFVQNISLNRFTKPIADKRRLYTPETVRQVTETLNLLEKENIIDEASHPQVICNLLPVEKCIEGINLGSKVDKYLNKKYNNSPTRKGLWSMLGS